MRKLVEGRRASKVAIRVERPLFSFDCIFVFIPQSSMSPVNPTDSLPDEKEKRHPFLSHTDCDGNGERRFALFVLPYVFLLLSGCLPSKSETNDHAGKEADSEVESAGEVSTDRGPQYVDGRSVNAGGNFQEAPMLERLVQAGKLPPVNERLPEKPLIITPVERPGIYGGTIRRALIADVIDQYAITKTLNENLMGYERSPPNRIQLNLAEDHWFENNGKSAIFKIRKGIKWSDGEPFTVDDILFWYEDFALDEEARNLPIFPSWWLNDAKPLILEKQDPYTLTISSHRPLGTILHTLSYDEIALPKHYFARYHPRYNANVTYAELRDRTTLAKLAYEPGTPRLSAWVPVSWTRGQRAVFERNPYYWKVDTAGNQLPYADKLEFTVIPNLNVILLKFINGEIDLISRYSLSRMYQTLRHEESLGRFAVHLGEPFPSYCFYLNWDARNPGLREAFRNRQVRIALSHGINRQEISETVYHGLLLPTGISLSRSSPVHSEKVAALYSQYDPAKARSLLDEAGYRDEDGDGIRAFKDGSPFEITIDVFANSDFPDICLLLVDYWADIGIKTHLNIALQEIIVPRRINGDFEVTVYRGPTDPVISSEYSAIMGPSEPFWHRNARREGPKWLHEMTALINQVKTTVDPEERRLMMVQIRDLHANNLPIITLGEARWIWASHKRLGNVPPRITTELHIRDWDRAVFHEQIYIKE